MKIIRYKHQDQEYLGWTNGVDVGEIEGDIYASYMRKPTSLSIDEVQLLTPVQPTKIICVGRNYPMHAKEHNAEVPDVPLLFHKPVSSLIGPEETIILPPQSTRVEHEAELCVVIGKRGRWIAPDEALEHVFGYTIANDVTARDLQRRDKLWTRGKGFDTFCPVGPWIETEYDPDDKVITCHVNQELKQMGSTSEMVFNIPALIVYISSIMTLEPGDIILTGTPAGVSILEEGATVEINIHGLGALSNPVAK